MRRDKSILLVDEDKIILNSLADFLRSDGFQVQTAVSYRQTLSELRSQRFNLVISDINLPDGDGFGLLEFIKKEYPQTVSILITANGTIESAVRAIKKGAYDYLVKPIIDDELRLSVERAIKQQSIISENQNLKLQLQRKYSLDNVISQDYKMAKIFELIEAVADSTTTILMEGPSGTGKSMLARAVHHLSSRKNGPFIEVSCGALPDTLLESELFGHIKGSFTGAVNDKEGKFLAADGGTIFLDEISSASPALQVKLLRVLEERQFEPVGSNKTITVDSRIVLASNRNLIEEVHLGRFREDLFYRINVVTVNMPPLRERVGDIEVLANHFLNTYCARHKRYKTGITPEAFSRLERYSWPGNIRELENVIERAVLLSKGPLIDAEDLPPFVMNAAPLESKYKQMSLKDALEEPECHYIQQALEANHWNRQKTAEQLELNRTTLFKKMKKYGLYAEAEKLGLI